MRGFGVWSVILLSGLAYKGVSAPAAEPKPEEDVHSPKLPPQEEVAEMPMVQPVAILMDNGDVVPLPMASGEPGFEDEAEVNAAEAYGEYPPMYYGAYPPPPPPPAAAYGYGGYEQEMVDGGAGRQLTQRGYGYNAGYYPSTIGGLSPYGRPGLISKPKFNKSIISKPIMNKGYLQRPAYYSYGPAYEVAETPIIEQPIYRPPPPPPTRPAVQPMYDSRIGAGGRHPYYPQLPAHISCPHGMKCTAKQYYVPAARPSYPRPLSPKVAKYLKKSGYGKNFRY